MPDLENQEWWVKKPFYKVFQQRKETKLIVEELEFLFVAWLVAYCPRRVLNLWLWSSYSPQDTVLYVLIVYCDYVLYTVTTYMYCTLWLCIVHCNYILYTATTYCTLRLHIVHCDYILYTATTYCTLWLCIVHCDYVLYTATTYCALQLRIVHCGCVLYTVTTYCTLWLRIVHCGCVLYTVTTYCTLWLRIVHCDYVLYTMTAYCTLFIPWNTSGWAGHIPPVHVPTCPPAHLPTCPHNKVWYICAHIYIQASRDLVMACHSPPLKKKLRNKGKCYYQFSVPSHLWNVELDGMGLRMGSGTSPWFFFFFLRGGLWEAITNFSKKMFLLLVSMLSTWNSMWTTVQWACLNLDHLFVPSNGVVLELHRTTGNHNHQSCQFVDKQAESSYYSVSDTILCMK